MNFLGDSRHHIDQKNRVFIPAKFRDGLGKTFTVCKAPAEKCLFLYPDEKWQKLTEEINALAPSPETRRKQRLFFYGSQTVEPDKQGRVTIAPKLCEYAGLTEEVVMFGVGERVEVWDAEAFDAMMNDDGGLDEMEIHY